MNDDLGAAIEERVREHERVCGRQLKDLQEFDRLFRCIPHERRVGEGTTFADTFVMEFFRDVESVRSSIDSTIFGDDPFMELLPRAFDPDSIRRSQNSQALLELQWELQDGRTKHDRILRSCLVNGTAVAEVPYRYRERMEQQQAGGQTLYAPKVWMDSPDLVNVPLARFAFDPAIQDPQDGWCVKTSLLNRREMDTLIEASRAAGAEVRTLDEIFIEHATVGGDGAEVAQSIRQGRGYDASGKSNLVREYWGDYPVKMADMTQLAPADRVLWRIVTVNGMWVIKMPNPYAHGLKPFLKATWIDLDESFYGIGLGHILRRPQTELNDFRNLKRDLVNFALNHPWQKSGGGPVQQDRLKLVPRRVFSVERDGRFEPLRPDLTVLMPAIRLEEMTKEDMRTSSGASVVAQALPSGVTATESRSIASESARRISGMASAFVNQITRRVLWFWNEMNSQFLSGTVNVRIFGDNTAMEPRSIGASDLAADPDVRVKIASDLEFRPQLIRRLSNTLKTLAEAKAVDPTIQINWAPMIAKLIKLHGERPEQVILPSLPPALPAGPPGSEVPGAIRQSLVGSAVQGSPVPSGAEEVE